jgi:DNA-directed RNA polymerase subunit alpha
MAYLLPETELVTIKETSRDGFYAQFEIEPLAPGYGVTLANSLRRVLLASLPGAAATSVRIDGVTHEFSTINGVTEDVVEIILNLKSLRLRLMIDEPVTLVLDKKGPGKVTAADFKKNADIEIMNPDLVIATLDQKGRLSMEVTCEKGRGYVTIEMRRDEKLPLGTIMMDSIFTPIKKVHYDVTHTRVGRMTNFDKIVLDITTDGTVDPYEALQQSSQILIDHFSIMAGLTNPTAEAEAIITPAEMPEESMEAAAVEEKPKRRSRKVKEQSDADTQAGA